MSKAKAKSTDETEDAVESRAALRVEDVIPAFDRAAIEEANKGVEVGDTIAGYTDAELREYLARNGTVPAGVAFNPYSRTPFSEFTPEMAERQAASQRQYDASGFGVVENTGADSAATAAAGDGAAPTGAGAGASTGGTGTRVSGPTGAASTGGSTA